MAELAEHVINTKVTESAKKRLEAICKQYDFTLYDMLQMLCDCLIRYMDDFHNLDENLIRVIRMFEGLPGWKNALRLTEPLEKEVKKEVTKGGVTKIVTEVQSAQIMEAFYVLRHPNGKGASRLVHVLRPVMEGDAEGWQATYNTQEQLKRFIELTNESLYNHLLKVGEALGTESFLDTIHRIADAYAENPDEVELRLQFEQNDWHKGAQMYEQKPYKRTYTPSEATQQKLFEVETNPNKEEEV